MNKLEKDLLFYSNYCLHSNNLINDLAKTPLHNKILYICIDDKKIKIPNFITRVPTVYLVKQRKVLIENEIGEWVNFNLRQLSSNSPNQNIPSNIQMQQQMRQMPSNMQMQQQMQQMPSNMQMPPQQMRQMPSNMQMPPQQQQNNREMPPHQQNNMQMPPQQQQNNREIPPQKKQDKEEGGEVLAYHNNEMGSEMSTSYSFIEETGNNSLNHNFSFLDGINSGDGINTPKEFDGSTNEPKKSQTDMAFDKLMEARNSDPISKGIQRI